MDKKRHLGCISQRSLVSPAQGKVTLVKIMLMPSILDKDEKCLKEKSSCQAQVYSYVFSLSLEYRSSYYQEGCNMVILTKSKCSKPRKSNERESKFQSVLKSLLSVRPVLQTDQTGWTYSRTSPVHRTCLVPSPTSKEVFWTCPVLNQTCPVIIMTVVI
jgi:hypothetical protein